MIGDVMVGDHVTLDDEEDCTVPPGTYQVSKVNENGSFHVGGNTAVWPRRILSVLTKKKD